MNATHDKVKTFWNDKPCNINHSNAELITYFIFKFGYYFNLILNFLDRFAQTIMKARTVSIRFIKNFTINFATKPSRY